MRSIYIFDASGEIKIKMNAGAYTLQTLRQIIEDLRRENNSIKLDASAEELLKKRNPIASRR